MWWINGELVPTIRPSVCCCCLVVWQLGHCLPKGIYTSRKFSDSVIQGWGILYFSGCHHYQIIGQIAQNQRERLEEIWDQIAIAFSTWQDHCGDQDWRFWSRPFLSSWSGFCLGAASFRHIPTPSFNRWCLAPWDYWLYLEYYKILF